MSGDDRYAPPYAIARLGVRVTRRVVHEPADRAGVVWEFRQPVMRRLLLGLLAAALAFVLLPQFVGGSREWLIWLVMTGSVGYAALIPRSQLRISRAGWEVRTSLHPFGLPLAIAARTTQTPHGTVEGRHARRRKASIELVLRAEAGDRVLCRCPMWISFLEGERTEPAMREVARRVEADARHWIEAKPVG
jgi:hypothetical protein